MLPVTPRPQEAIGRMRFKRRRCNIVCSFVSVPVVALRIELSTTRLSAVSGPPALDYHLVKSGTSGSNRDPPAPKAGVLPSAPLPESLCQWTCRELNPEALSANQSADPSASPLFFSDPCGIRTRPRWLERPVTSPEVERAVASCPTKSPVGTKKPGVTCG